MQGARIAETPDTKPASCWICHPPSQCHGRAFRGEGSVICTASPSSQHANPRLGTVHPQFHERPHGRPVHHFMTKFEIGTVTRVLRQTSRAARHSQHDEEMRGPAATRGEKVSTSLTWRKSGFSHITSRLGLAWISEAGLISGAPRNSSLDLSRCWNLPLSPRTDLTADLMASLWHTFLVRINVGFPGWHAVGGCQLFLQGLLDRTHKQARRSHCCNPRPPSARSDEFLARSRFSLVLDDVEGGLVALCGRVDETCCQNPAVAAPETP